MQLRDYQQKTIDDIYKWFGKNSTGNPCVVLPTGSGKSIIIAALIKDAMDNWPTSKIMLLCHVKELILQDAEKLLGLWKQAPLGIYSAGIGEKQFDKQITFAGIQSIWRHAERVGHVDLILIDECHLINHSDQGQYREFLSGLLKINPDLRIIGLTATPYRLGHGMIHEGEDTLFNAIIEPTSIEHLVYNGYLAPLRSKHTSSEIDVSGVAKRGGEFVAGALERAVDREEITRAIVTESLSRAEGCRSIIFFCTGVDHAEHMCAELTSRGVSAACVTGKTAKTDRERILKDFRSGAIRALTNANVLTTGFDAPDIDCIVMARPTMSPGLYVQMAGRGMRLKSHTDHCLVLDFAGNVSRHGPITAIEPPSNGGGPAPTKDCPECEEIVFAGVMTCPTCGHQFPASVKEPEEKAPPRLHNDDIMGLHPREMSVSDWQWRGHVSRASGKPMLTVTYYGTTSVLEYLPVLNDGPFGEKMRALLVRISHESKVSLPRMELSDVNDMSVLADALNAGTPPQRIKYRKEGKFFKVLEREF